MEWDGEGDGQRGNRKNVERRKTAEVLVWSISIGSFQTPQLGVPIAHVSSRHFPHPALMIQSPKFTPTPSADHFDGYNIEH
jgi:hypothetical protein